MDATQKITKNLGGNRLGSGSKNNIDLHSYNRSTHDLSYAFRSTMNVGTLVPFMKFVGLNGDTFSIDLDEIVRTLPSKAPLYGSYKLQLDVFECPIRLYNGLLHNNMTKIGLNMGSVKLPKMEISTKVYNRAKFSEDLNKSQIASDSLLAYLGIRGIGDVDFTGIVSTSQIITRKFNAVPVMAYYDIYKCYYSNKQEEKGAIIFPDPITTFGWCNMIHVLSGGTEANVTEYHTEQDSAAPSGITLSSGEKYQNILTYTQGHWLRSGIMLVNAESIYFEQWNFPVEMTTLKGVVMSPNNTLSSVAFSTLFGSVEQQNDGSVRCRSLASAYANYKLMGIIYKKHGIQVDENLGIKVFDLAEIDDMRISVLQNTGLNNELEISTLNGPFGAICQVDQDNCCVSKYHQCGLALKTYQSDLFNNWLKTEWLDGVNGINKITAIDTSSGSFEIDALNLANKVYNMLNRVAVSGGTYEDWQEAVYSVEANRRAETPVYKGGMSAEIMFNEVVSQSATEKDPLGTLAGKGGDHAKKGGQLEIRCTEPSYIIGLVSITPRLDYSQGNDWDMCELDTLDDLHKPALDGIGFEDLLQERMAYWGTYYQPTGVTKWVKLAAGKVPAWMNYMTNVNKTFGGFAEQDNAMFMTLNRRYQYPTGDNTARNDFGITDLTTYIDPAKYNYIFADASLTAQNFWVQIGCKVIARRVMSGKILPNL